MTRERCKELLPVMEAYAKGEEVQWCYNPATLTVADSFWRDYAPNGIGYVPDINIDNPNLQMRIKPKPLEVWAVWCESDGGPIRQGTVFLTEARAKEVFGEASFGCGATHRIIKLREVEEGQ